MRQRRLLERRNEVGAAPVEFIFTVIFTLLLLFGVVEVAFALYGRNVLASSAHEAARSAVELRAGMGDAEALAHNVVARSTGALVEGYEVDVSSVKTGERVIVRVTVAGQLDPPGPLPVKIPVRLTATAMREELP